MKGRHVSPAYRNRRLNKVFRILILAAMVAGFLLIAIMPSARAVTPQAVPDIPLIDVCPKEAPFAVTPQSGLSGLLGERPVQITATDDPRYIWSTGGFAGLRAHTYDLGCAMDPTSWFRNGSANAQAGTTNVFLDVGNGVVALTDSVDRRAWDPTYLTSIMKDLSQRVTRVVNERIIVPCVALALIAGTILLLHKSSDGDMSGVISHLGWIGFVLTVSSLLVAMPLLLPEGTNRVTGTAVGFINGGSNPSDSTTNTIVYSVQYQSWLRRNFGLADSEAALKHGPALLASTRFSWAEMDAAATPELRKELVEKKSQQFKDIAAQVEKDDPIAYKSLTGQTPGAGGSIVELMVILVASVFRLMNSLMAIACQLSVVFMAAAWLIGTPLWLLPDYKHFSGQRMAMGLIDSVVRAVRYVLSAVAGAWLFGIYLQAIMQPGMSIWWSFLLLLIGTVIAWSVIRPDRKFISIISFGHWSGYSETLGRMLKTGVAAWATGAVAGTVAGHVLDDDEPPRRSEEVPVVHADIFHPTQPFVPETPTTVDAEPLEGRVVQPLPSGLPYEPTVQAEAHDIPAPPPDESASPYVPYERSDDSEGADK